MTPASDSAVETSFRPSKAMDGAPIASRSCSTDVGEQCADGLLISSPASRCTGQNYEEERRSAELSHIAVLLWWGFGLSVRWDRRHAPRAIVVQVVCAVGPSWG